MALCSPSGVQPVRACGDGMRELQGLRARNPCRRDRSRKGSTTTELPSGTPRMSESNSPSAVCGSLSLISGLSAEGVSEWLTRVEQP